MSSWTWGGTLKIVDKKVLTLHSKNMGSTKSASETSEKVPLLLSILSFVSFGVCV